MRFLLVPLAFAILVIGPFLIWGEALGALFAGDPAKAVGGWEFAGWIVGAGLLIADLFLPIPTTAVIAALGILYGPVVGALVALAGSLAAAAIGYGIGRWAGRPAAERLLKIRTEGAERVFARWGGWIVAASRWAPVLPEVVSAVAGVARMPPGAFFAAVLCGAAPLCALFAWIGWLGAEAPGWTLALSALAPLGLWFLAERAGLTRRLGLTTGEAE